MFVTCDVVAVLADPIFSESGNGLDMRGEAESTALLSSSAIRLASDRVRRIIVAEESDAW